MIKTVRTAILEAKVNPVRIFGIGVSGQQHGLVPLDNAGTVIRPAKLWNDTSTAEECRWLINKLGGVSNIVNLTGNTILPGFTAGKILWLKLHEPNNYSRLHTILLPHDYLNLWLTGNVTMEPGDASGTALMDSRTRRWRREIIDAIDPDLIQKLPEIQTSTAPAGVLRKHAATELGLSEGILVSSGGGDNMMAAIGTGNTKPGIVTVSLGTSGTAYAYSEKPVIDLTGEMHSFCDSTGAWLPLVCTMNVTIATELVRRFLGYGYDELERSIEDAPVGSGGLLLLPYFSGERTPNVPNGKGVLYGLTSETFKVSNLVRASMEGATLGLNFGLNRLRELGINPEEIRLTGGGSKNKTWRRIAADVFGTTVVCIKVDEGAAYGAALQALWIYRRSLGVPDSISDITDMFVELDEESRIVPNSLNVTEYRHLQNLQDRLSCNLRSIFREFPS